MIIDESSARIVIIKKLRYLLKKKKYLSKHSNSKPKKSRQVWVKSVINAFNETSWIIGLFETGKYHASVLILEPEVDGFNTN